jgi:hypothetical protein
MAKRKCANCKQFFKLVDMARIYGTNAWCSENCAAEWAIKTSRKLREGVAKAEKKAVKENSLAHQEELTQKVVNRLAVMLDIGRPCISCGKYLPLEAGHYRSVGSMPTLRFDLRNIHGQCRPCNVGGTLSARRGKNRETVSAMFRAALRERYGAELAGWLDGWHAPQKRTAQEVKNIRRIILAEISHIKTTGLKTRDWR